MEVGWFSGGRLWVGVRRADYEFRVESLSIDCWWVFGLDFAEGGIALMGGGRGARGVIGCGHS